MNMLTSRNTKQVQVLTDIIINRDVNKRIDSTVNEEGTVIGAGKNM